MADTPSYNHAEIQRYLQQKMSRQEMHEFEKALMNDPFLADALEGFSASDPTLAREHLAEIEQRLTASHEEAKVVPLPSSTTEWWKIAAIILVIISAGAITYSVVNNSSVSENEEQVAASTPSTLPFEKDSLRPADHSLASAAPLNKKELLANKKNGSPIIHSDGEELLDRRETKIDAGKAEETNQAIASLAPTANQNAAAPEMMKLQRGLAQNEFKGTVVDKAGEPLPFAAIKSNNGNAATVSDGNGNFSLKASDSVLDVNVISPGYAPKIAKLRSNKPDNKIALRDEELSLSEMVVSDQLKKKKNVVASVQVDTSVAAEPIGGWKNFKQYLNQQIDSLKATEQHEGFDEDIVLEFSIDTKGQPVNIKASPGTDKAISEKAAQILRNGPRWNNKKNDKKVKVIIAF
ncbi:carboxypeptidase-like regulatory domain-containing protein [Segetibacter aerophilus]|uniref:TonB C-terminal domain-containing protein n=1 Tax=Segetibacter aerophilus TaxID=670293 RepID=A0A512B8F9_9BACT|nr:carboxypeptidase-like regulatory domain-containing protein [Segetibacter aerophilus]GEO08244.1 hypothetical protein SAE01_07400 [Segetibacter aerophilus]